MVNPLPSGVMRAPKITIAIIAYLKFLIQKFNPKIPVNDKKYMIKGS